MIAVENLTKVYGKRAALDHVSFEVPAREIFGFVWPRCWLRPRAAPSSTEPT